MTNHILNENLDLVALQETIKQGFEDWELKELAGNIDFKWLWIPARGHSGGMIMGVRAESFEVEDSVFENFFTGVLVRNRVTNYRYWVINVYGPA